MTKPGETTATAAVIDMVSRRHRPVPASSAAVQPFVGDDEHVGEAASLIAILADALESIVATTTDASARATAASALVEFQGR